MAPGTAAIALACAALIGFAAHRASLCNVRAVVELLHERRATVLASLLQAVLWMTTLTGVLVLAAGITPQPAVERLPLAAAVAGGLLFGIGAGLNGGCSLSTLNRLADGDLGMLLTLAGFALGVTAWPLLQRAGLMGSVAAVPSPWLRWPTLAPWLLGVLLAWALWQARRLWRRLPAKARPLPLILRPAYPPAVAALLLGLAGGLLYATQGAWSYTSFVRTELLHGLGAPRMPTPWHGALVLALLGGMLVSALQRRSFRLRGPSHARAAALHLAGGATMGAGAALLPGGNDTLLLTGLPSLTLTAAASYLALLAGIAAVVIARRPRSTRP